MDRRPVWFGDMQMTPREGGRHSWVDPNPRDEAVLWRLATTATHPTEPIPAGAASDSRGAYAVDARSRGSAKAAHGTGIAANCQVNKYLIVVSSRAGSSVQSP